MSGGSGSWGKGVCPDGGVPRVSDFRRFYE